VQIRKTLYVAKRHEWRAWLKENHATETEIWLIYYKKHTGKPRIPYDDAVEEALCFGWIDSIVQRIDDEKYAQKFTPRKDRSKWSQLNRRRFAKLIKEGRMTEAGLAKINQAVAEKSSEGRKSEKRSKELAIPGYVKEGLKANRPAWENFQKLAPSHRRNYIGWITSAKREETRNRRLGEAIKLLVRNKKLGLK
jgi:uncharacterized protein YdeI (YjbR/CyaY-like superfamily)